MKSINTIMQLKDELETNQVLRDQFKQDPVQATEDLQKNRSALPDTWIYRIVVGSLGLSILLVIIGTIILNPTGDAHLPTVFTAIASGAIGALAGLLAPSPAK